VELRSTPRDSGNFVSMACGVASRVEHDVGSSCAILSVTVFREKEAGVETLLALVVYGVVVLWVVATSC
jgi:hypothetical protein